MKKASSPAARRFRLFTVLTLGSTSALACHSLRAGDANWTGTTSNDYNVGTNWSSGVVPFVVGTSTFNGPGNGNTTIINATTSINQFVFDTANAAAYTVGTTANTISLDNNSAGGTVAMRSTVLNNETINASFLLGNLVTSATASATGNFSFNNNTNLGTGRTLTFGGNVAGITPGASGTAGAQVLTLNGPGSGVLSGNISNGGAASLQVTVASGVWTLSGANSFAGPTFTQDGLTYTRGVLLSSASSVLRIGSGGALGNGVLNITNQATLQAVNGDQTVNRDFVLNNNGFTVSGSNSLTTTGKIANNGTPTITNNIVAGKVFEVDGNVEIRNNTGARTVIFNGSGSTVLAGSVINNNATLTGFTATGSVSYTGTGNLTMSGANTYTGTTSVTSGALTLDYTNNAGTKISGTGTGGALTLAGGALNLTGGATTETVTSTTLNPGTSAFNRTSGNSTINLGAIARNPGATLTLNAPGFANVTGGAVNATLKSTTNTVYGVVGGDDWAATAVATNTPIVGFSSVGTYSPSTATTVTSGSNTDVVTDVTLGAAAATNTLRFNTASARTITATGQTLSLANGGVLVTPAVGNNLTTITGGTLAPGANNALVIFQNNTANGLAIASTVANNGANTSSLTKAGAGLLTLSNPTNSYTGITYLNGGTTNIAADASLGTAPAAAAAAQLSMNGGTLQFGASNIALAANRGVTLGGNGGTMDTNGATGSSVAGIITGTGNFTKTGSGILTLNPSAVNTNTGATIVSGGTLSLARAGSAPGVAVVSGTLAAAVPIFVNSTGTLLLGANNTIGATSPITLSGGGISVADTVVQGSAGSAGTAGTSFVGAGMLTLTANSTLTFVGNAGTAVFSSFDPTNTLAGNFRLTVTGGNFGTAASSVDGTNDRLVFNQLLSATQLGDILFVTGGNTYAATEFQLGTSAFYEIVPGAIVSIPEPGTWAGCIVSVLGLAFYLRRRSDAFRA